MLRERFVIVKHFYCSDFMGKAIVLSVLQGHDSNYYYGKYLWCDFKVLLSFIFVNLPTYLQTELFLKQSKV